MPFLLIIAALSGQFLLWSGVIAGLSFVEKKVGRYDHKACYVASKDSSAVFRIVEELEHRTLAVIYVQNPQNGVQYLAYTENNCITKVSERYCKFYESKVTMDNSNNLQIAE